MFEDIPFKFIHRRSNVSGYYPTDLQSGEFFIQHADKELFFLDSEQNLVKISNKTGTFATRPYVIENFVATGDTGNFLAKSQTGSFVTISQTGNFAASAHQHANYVDTGSTGLFLTTSQTGSFAANTHTHDIYVNTGGTGSFITTNQTGNFAASTHTHTNYVDTGSTGNFLTISQTGDFVHKSESLGFITSGETGAFAAVTHTHLNYVDTGSTGSFITTAMTGAFGIAGNVNLDLYVQTGQTGVFATSSQLTNYVGTGSTGSFVTTQQTGVFVASSELTNYVGTGSTGSFVTTQQTGAFANLNGGSYLNTNQIPNITGDVCINAGSNISTLYKIRGYPVSTNPPSIGQTLQFDGTYWAPGALPAGGNGGGGLVYYFNDTIAPDAPTTNLPTSLSGTFELGRTGVVNQYSITYSSLPATYSAIAGFVTDVLDPDAVSVPAGLFDFNIWMSASSATAVTFQATVYKYNGSTTTATLLSSSDELIIYNNATITQYAVSTILPETNISLTDRIFILLSAKSSSNKSITLYFGGTTPSHVHTTLSSVGGSGIVKVINGVMQNPASAITDSDISASAAIAGTKIQTNYFALASATGSFVTTTQTGSFAASTHTHEIYVNTGNTGSFITTTQTGNFAASTHTHANYVDTSSTGSFLTTGAGYLSVSAIAENMIVCNSATFDLINFDVIASSSLYYVCNSTANFGLNLRGSSSCTFNNLVPLNKTLSVTLLNTNGTTAYNLTGVTVDGAVQTIKWLNGTGGAPAGNTGSIDSYSITAIKTGSSLYRVFGSQGKYA